MSNKSLFSLIPKVDEILESDIVRDMLKTVPRPLVLDSIREVLDNLRNKIKDDELGHEELMQEINGIIKPIKALVDKKNHKKLRQVINCTGVVLHTNLGRSLVSEEVMDNLGKIATNYSNLEYDLELGERGSRYSHLEEIINRITGGEASMVVNNNAAAVMLVLSTLAKDKEVIVSRGELIEIGGSFRVPDVMEQSGARLVEVGTTNKTHLGDYENKINEDTGALLKVHTSNYRILGFTSSVSIEDLVSIKEKYNLPIIEDLGSGVLIDLSQYGLEYEPTVQDSIKKGVDIVTFSGDKLLGGPQAGIIVGKKDFIDKMKKNPLTRAFRIDKFIIGALEATLRYYLDIDLALEKIPTINMLTLSLEELTVRGLYLEHLLKENIKDDKIDFSLVDDFSEVGGGSLPLEKLKTKCICIDLKDISISQFEKKLRDYEIPLIVRIYKDKIYLDIRTIREKEYNLVQQAISWALEKCKE